MPKPLPSLFWYDYETWGSNPRKDRVAQFAGIRTDLDLNPIGDEEMFYCRPSSDFLPHPEAAMITHIVPQKAQAEGLIEHEFFQRVNALFATPNTCVVGYNSLRFDDEMSRYGFFRNFINPYAREWQNGNSRWDILDLMRACHALRPEGIQWPVNDDGKTSFKLEHLVAENQLLETHNAHDALGDVRATIALARKVKQAQPKLFEFYFKLRQKQAVTDVLQLDTHKPFAHISGMFPVEQGCLSVMMAVAINPNNKNEVLCVDLRHDPSEMLSLDAQQINTRLYTSKADLELAEMSRPPIKGIHINKSPFVAPINTISEHAAQQWRIDWDEIEGNRQKIINAPLFKNTLIDSATQPRPLQNNDADSALYDGFINRNDEQLITQMQTLSPEQKVDHQPAFTDARLQQLYPRYLARNWPHLLSEKQQHQWQNFCRESIIDGLHGATLNLEQFEKSLHQASLEYDSDDKTLVLQQLAQWVSEL